MQTVEGTRQNTGTPHTIKPEIHEHVLEVEEGPFTNYLSRAGNSS